MIVGKMKFDCHHKIKHDLHQFNICHYVYYELQSKNSCFVLVSIAQFIEFSHSIVQSNALSVNPQVNIRRRNKRKNRNKKETQMKNQNENVCDQKKKKQKRE